MEELQERVELLPQDLPRPPPTQEVHRVAVKMPPFWRERPTLWFAQLEAQFTLAAISEEKTKFAYVVASLEERYANEVEEIIQNPPNDNPYTFLKTELIKRLSLSLEKRVRQLISEEELGDRKPSQLLRHLKLLAGSVVQEPLLKTLWLQRLPVHVQAILQTQANLQIDQLAATADKIVEVSPVSTVNAVKEDFDVCQKMESLSLQLANLQKELRDLKRSRSRSRSKSRYRSPNNSFTSDECWYHQRFKEKATKCRQPCKFVSKNEN